MKPEFPTLPARRYLVTSSTQAAFALATGLVAAAPWATNPAHQPVNTIYARSLAVRFIAEGNADAVVSFKIWGFKQGNSDLPTVGGKDYLLECVGYGDFTLGTLVGPSATGSVRSTERVADAINFALTGTATNPRGPGEALTAALGEGAPVVHSPSNNEVAVLLFPSLLRYDGFIIEFDLPNSGVTSANAHITENPV